MTREKALADAIAPRPVRPPDISGQGVLFERERKRTNPRVKCVSFYLFYIALLYRPLELPRFSAAILNLMPLSSSSL